MLKRTNIYQIATYKETKQNNWKGGTYVLYDPYEEALSKISYHRHNVHNGNNKFVVRSERALRSHER